MPRPASGCFGRLWRSAATAGCTRRCRLIRAGCGFVYGYGTPAVRVHEDHPHLFVLCLLADGPAVEAAALVRSGGLHLHVLNMLALSRNGRLCGPRYLELPAVVAAVESPRLDLTLVLAVVNIAVLALLLRDLAAGLDLVMPDPRPRARAAWLEPARLLAAGLPQQLESVVAEVLHKQLSSTPASPTERHRLLS